MKERWGQWYLKILERLIKNRVFGFSSYKVIAGRLEAVIYIAKSKFAVKSEEKLKK